MSKSINHVSISGNLTRDAELRVTPGGTNILRFTVAVNDRRRNKSTGEWEDYANFVDCVMFGRRAEALSGYLLKGEKVAVDGSLSFSTWEDKNGGGRRSKLEVAASDIDFLGSARKSSSQAQGQQATADGAVSQIFPGAEVSEMPASAYTDEDIDF